MKIAFTADVHLNTAHPERTRALANVLEQVAAAGIERLIIAGDLFDKDRDAASLQDFERICSERLAVQVIVIPGNHDPSLHPDQLAQSNVQVIHEPTTLDFDGTSFLLAPYANGGMADDLADQASALRGKPWNLVGHGDYMSGMREPNPYEPDIYMPLTRQDVVRLAPDNVILGHIHVPTPLDRPFDGKVLYLGSPHGLDVSETGRRRFLIYDGESRSFEEKEVVTDLVFLQERFFVFPAADEVGALLAQIPERGEAWGASDAERSKVRVRAHAYGHTRNRQAIKDALAQGFAEAGVLFYEEEEPKLKHLIHAVDDRQLDTLAQRALGELENADFTFDGDEPSFEEARLVVLKTIYGD